MIEDRCEVQVVVSIRIFSQSRCISTKSNQEKGEGRISTIAA
jgi:hypothetical protein